MLPETSMSTWIPALHAGMTQSRGLCLNWPKAPPPVFSKEATKFTIRNIQTLRDLRDLRGEKVLSSLHNKSFTNRRSTAMYYGARGIVGLVKPTYRPGSMESFIKLMPE